MRDSKTFDAAFARFCEQDKRSIVAADVMIERCRQDSKWGVQSHPDGTGDEHFGFQAKAYRTACDSAAKAGDITWRHILIEEFYEAMTETDPARLRAELCQVAAVAQAWMEDIDGRTQA